jgi:hypothetical protein
MLVAAVIQADTDLPTGTFPGPRHSRTQSPSYARSTERDEGLWPNPYQTGIWLATTKVIVLITYISFTMFLWFPVLDLARAPRRTARKKGSGYENGSPAKYVLSSYTSIKKALNQMLYLIAISLCIIKNNAWS